MRPAFLAPGELPRVMIWSLVIILIILAPYAFAYGALNGTDLHFMGHIYAVDEGEAYMTWARQAAEGHWAFENRYTTEPGKRLFVNLLMLAWGKSARLLHVAPVAMLQATRLVSGWACLVAIYLLAALLFEQPLARWAALLTAAFSSGLGWLFFLINPYLHPVCVDFGLGLIQPEAVSFLALSVNALFSTSMALMTLVFFFFLWGLTTDNLRLTLWAGLGGLLLGNIHTYDVLIFGGTIGLYVAWTAAHKDMPLARLVRHAAVVWVAALPGPLWAAYTIHADPLYAAKANIVLSPYPPLTYVMSYGLVLLLALIGAVCVLWSYWPGRPLLFAWLIVGILLPYFPAPWPPWKRKLFEGFHICLALLAAAAVAYVIWPALCRALERRGWRTGAAGPALLAAVVLVTVPSNAFFVWDCTRNLVTNNQRLLMYYMPPLFLTGDEWEAMKWLEANSEREAVVLSSNYMGNHIPVVAGNRVYCGHWGETINYPRKLNQVRDFYAGLETPMTREDLLRASGARYVFESRYEEAVAGDFPEPLETEPFLKLVYQNRGVRIYEVNLPAR